MEHIIFVTISMAGGGSERVISTLANYYIKNNFSVSIFMIGGDRVEYELDERIDLRQISSETSGNFYARINRIASLRKAVCEFDNPTVIAIGSVASMFTSLSTVGVKKRLILSERSNPNNLNRRPIKWHERFARNVLYSLAEKIVFQTPMAMDCFPAYIQRKGQIILNPLAETIPPCVDYSNRDNKILYMGRLEKEKNPILLVKAFRKIHELYPEYLLEFFGEGELKEEVQKQIKEFNLDGFVKLKGRTSTPLDVMAHSKIFVSCSNWEGISNSLVESLAMGMRAVATDCPMGGNRLLADMYGGIVLTLVDNEEELFLAIRDTIENKSGYDTIEISNKIRYDLNTKRISEEWLIN